MENNTGNKKIKSALISVYSKDGLEPLVRTLHSLGVQIISTGGTQDFIEKLGIKTTSVDSLTQFPEVFGGRVKTLHPKIFGGILHRRENSSDNKEKETHQIQSIDLVVVDLYPFEETLATGAPEVELIEKIDIGGISLIRAAAKNFEDVVIVPSKNEYAILLHLLKTQQGQTSRADRRALATRAFAVSSGYDAAIHGYFSGGQKSLRYGENPHQKGIFKGNLEELFHQLHGKELSYNNLLDLDAALGLLAEFDEPSFLILKHNNPCGASSAKTVKEAWEAALAADPLSAFGGVLACNREVDAITAESVNKIFFEVLIAPSFTKEALNILQQKKNRILLQLNRYPDGGSTARTVLNGTLIQDRDTVLSSAAELKVITQKAPDAAQTEDLLFAEKIAKHARSNAMVLVRDKKIVGIGAGLTSRVDALKHAIQKAGEFKLSTAGSVLASDAFLPFKDSVEIAHAAGVLAVLQPGGSVKDNESIDFCNAHGMAMVFTGTRHFRH